MTELPCYVSRRLADAADRLPRGLSEALPQASGCLSETPCRLRNRTTGPERLPAASVKPPSAWLAARRD